MKKSLFFIVIYFGKNEMKSEEFGAVSESTIFRRRLRSDCS